MYLELSYVLGPGASYPDSPPDVFEPVLRQASGDSANTSTVHHFLHNGTHLDAPFHFDGGGRRIEDLPLESFIYEAPVLVEVPKRCGEVVSREDLEGKDLAGADVLLIRTGFDELRRTDPAGYRVMYPGLTPDAARMLRDELPRLKAIIIDFVSVDGYLSGNRTGFPVHHQLLGTAASGNRPVLVVEDANLEPVVGRKLRRVLALPVRFQGGEAAPVCVVAEVD